MVVMSPQNDKIIERLIQLAHGDIDLVSLALKESAKGREAAKLSDVISFIQRELERHREVA